MCVLFLLQFGILYFILGFRGQHVDPEELFRNIFGDNFNFKNFSESDEFESTQYGFAQAQEVCKSWETFQQYNTNTANMFITNSCLQLSQFHSPSL